MIRTVSVAIVSLLVCAGAGRAAVNTVAWYRMGEADPAPANGTTINSTQDSSLFNKDLTLQLGVPVYTNTGAVAGSTWAGDFERGDGRDVLTNGVLTTVVDNFGVEAWIKLESNTGTQLIAYNGNSNTDGWGLILYNNTLSYLYGGKAVGATAVTPALNTWMHVAFVRTNGVEMIFTNGTRAAISSYPFGKAAPNTPVSSSHIGGAIVTASDGLDGLLDEVRFFTFSSGQFRNTDLLYFQTIPEPSALTLVGMGLLGLAFLHRRRQ